VGLAAPQVGVNVRIMVYNPEGEKGKGREWILVNPRIISSGKGLDTMEEGCLSFQDASIDLQIRAAVTVWLCAASPSSQVIWEHSLSLPLCCYILYACSVTVIIVIITSSHQTCLRPVLVPARSVQEQPAVS